MTIVYVNGYPILEPNVIIQGDGFYVSYNYHDQNIYGYDTTALVLGQMEHFYILNGDHRIGYIELIPKGLAACMEYFKQNMDQMNRYSEKPI